MTVNYTTISGQINQEVLGCKEAIIEGYKDYEFVEFCNNNK